MDEATKGPVRMIDDEFAGVDTSNLRECVARGAALLDEKIPGWAEQVRGSIIDGLFNMRQWENCIVGQLELVQTRFIEGEDQYVRNVIAFNGTAIKQFASSVHEAEAVCALGFDVDQDEFADIHSAYNDLQTYWTEEVAERTNITAA